jgi:hypothetical protein
VSDEAADSLQVLLAEGTDMGLAVSVQTALRTIQTFEKASEAVALKVQSTVSSRKRRLPTKTKHPSTSVEGE